MIDSAHVGADRTRRAVAAAAALVLLALLPAAPLLVVLLLWEGLLVVQALLIRRTAAMALLFLAITLYASTAWLAAEYGDRIYAPWPSLGLVTDVTTQDLAAVLGAYAVAELVVGAGRLGAAVSEAARTVRRQVAAIRSSTPDFIASVLLVVVGALDWMHLLTIGIGTVLSGARRQYATDLVLGDNHNAQVVVIAATVYLVSRAIAGRGSLNGIVLTVFAWTPFLLVGSRKEAIVTAAILALIWGPTLRLRANLTLLGGGVLTFLLPSLRSGSIYDALHEFILPQYMHFAIAMGLVPHDLGGTFLERAWFLVPSIVRPVQIDDFGQAFGALGITSVGIGASPFGEAALSPFLGSTLLTFAVVFLAAMLVIVVAARRFPAITVVGFGLLVVYGRSDFWTFLFFAFYTGAALALLLGRAGRAAPQTDDASELVLAEGSLR